MTKWRKSWARVKQVNKCWGETAEEEEQDEEEEEEEVKNYVGKV